jgi:predicted NBD/HSP70 family sugar kinase
VTADRRGHGAAPATLGVDLGGTGTRVAALSADGEVLREASFPTVAHDPAAAVSGLADTLAQIADGLKVSASGPEVEESRVIVDDE